MLQRPSSSSRRRRGHPARVFGGIVLVAALWGAGCKTAEEAAAPQELAVEGVVIMPDSTALFGAEISTDPPTVYVSTDEQGRFRVLLPRPDTYTFIATHPAARYRDMEGRVTEVEVAAGQQAVSLVIVIGRTQRMPLMQVGERAPPAVRRGKKRTG